MNTKIIIFLLITVPTLVACTDFKRMSYAPAGRDEWQRPQKVMEVLNIKQGEVIADLGAGGGYFTFHLANRVGANGKVFAIDTDRDMITYLNKEISKLGYTNIETLIATPTNPGLDTRIVDMIFCSNTFHHFENPAHYFTQLKSYLQPQGRVAIVDFRNEGWFKRLMGHTTTSEVIIQALTDAGYKLVNEYDFLSQQHFLVFTPAQGQ